MPEEVVSACFGAVKDAETFEAVAGAQVAVLSRDRETVLLAGETAASGQFECAGMVWGDGVVVRVEAPGYAALEATRRVGDLDDFMLQRAILASMRLETPLGDPVVDATVRLRSPEVIATAIKGELLVDLAPMRKLLIWVLPAHGVPWKGRLETSAEPKQEFLFVIPDAPHQLDVVVRGFETGEPLVGAELRVEDLLVATTDEGGLASLALPDGEIKLTASAAGHSPASRRVDVEGRSWLGPVELQLPRAGSLVVQVLDADTREPVARARCDLAVAVAGPMLEPRDPEVRFATPELKTVRYTGEDGRAEWAELALSYGAPHCSVSCIAPGYAGQSHQSMRVAGTEDEAVTIELRKEATLKGSVFVNGEPVRARLYFRLDGLHIFGWSEDDGSFLVRNLPAGRLDVEISVDGKANAWTQSVTVVEGKESTADFRLVHETTRTLGRVSLPDGSALSNAAVYASADIRRVRDLTSTTDQDGRFELWLPDPGDLSYTVGVAGREGSYEVEGVRPGDFVELECNPLGPVGLRFITSELTDYVLIDWRRTGGEGELERYEGPAREIGDGEYEVTLPVGVIDLKITCEDRSSYHEGVRVEPGRPTWVDVRLGPVKDEH